MAAALTVFHLGGDLPGSVLQGFLNASVKLGLKEGFEDLLAFLRARQKELPELPLGEHDDLAELVAPECQHAFDLFRDFPPLGGQDGSLVSVVHHVGTPPQGCSRPFGRCALATSAGSLLFWTSNHSIDLVKSFQAADIAARCQGDPFYPTAAGAIHLEQADRLGMISFGERIFQEGARVLDEIFPGWLNPASDHHASSNRREFSSLDIPAVLKLFLIMATGTSA